MVLEARINTLKKIIDGTKREFERAVDAGKSFYIKKEILQRLRSAIKQLDELNNNRGH